MGSSRLGSNLGLTSNDVSVLLVSAFIVRQLVSANLWKG